MISIELIVNSRTYIATYFRINMDYLRLSTKNFLDLLKLVDFVSLSTQRELWSDNEAKWNTIG
jgi:hypothetical protein